MVSLVLYWLLVAAGRVFPPSCCPRCVNQPQVLPSVHGLLRSVIERLPTVVCVRPITHAIPPVGIHQSFALLPRIPPLVMRPAVRASLHVGEFFTMLPEFDPNMRAGWVRIQTPRMRHPKRALDITG